MPVERRRRMSRHINLVLVGGGAVVLGGAVCCGCGGLGGDTHTQTAAEPMQEVEEVEETPPPEGAPHLMGGPFVAWWALTHPPRTTIRAVPRSVATGGGYTRTTSGGYRRTFYGGRSGYLAGGGSTARPPSSSSGGAVRGGFGNTGHASSGGA